MCYGVKQGNFMIADTFPAVQEQELLDNSTGSDLVSFIYKKKEKKKKIIILDLLKDRVLPY